MSLYTYTEVVNELFGEPVGGYFSKCAAGKLASGRLWNAVNRYRQTRYPNLVKRKKKGNNSGEISIDDNVGEILDDVPVEGKNKVAM